MIELLDRHVSDELLDEEGWRVSRHLLVLRTRRPGKRYGILYTPWWPRPSSLALCVFRAPRAEVPEEVRAVAEARWSKAMQHLLSPA